MALLDKEANGVVCPDADKEAAEAEVELDADATAESVESDRSAAAGDGDCDCAGGFAEENVGADAELFVNIIEDEVAIEVDGDELMR